MGWVMQQKQGEAAAHSALGAPGYRRLFARMLLWHSPLDGAQPLGTISASCPHPSQWYKSAQPGLGAVWMSDPQEVLEQGQGIQGGQ